MNQVILHLTDLHFGWERNESIKRAERELSLRELKSAIENLEGDWKPTIICISGDIGWSGSRSDYIEAKQWLDEILKICKLQYESVVTCAGNHDVDRVKARTISVPSAIEEADRVLAIIENPNLIDPFSEYITFCENSGIPPYIIDGKESFLVGERIVNDIRFVALNSSWYCQGDQDKGKLWMGYPHMRYLDASGKFPVVKDKSDSKLTVALIHHPFEWIVENDLRVTAGRPNPKDYLAHRCHALLSGHEHAELRIPDQIAMGMYHFKGAATYAGSSHDNGFSLLKISNVNISHRTFKFSPAAISKNWTAHSSDEFPFHNRGLSEIPIGLTNKAFANQLNNIPTLHTDFIGREQELLQLEDVLLKSKKAVLLNGIGGIGKTTLAKCFVNRRLSNYNHVVWINISKQDGYLTGKLNSDSIKEVIANDRLLIHNLKISERPGEENLDFRFEMIMNAFRNLGEKNLLVIDNAGGDLGKAEILNLLPQAPAWQVLVTSRQVHQGFTNFRLENLNPSEAHELFCLHYPYESDKQTIDELIKIFDFHILIIELFAKTLSAHYGSLTVEQLYQKVKTRQLNDPDLQRKINSEYSNEEHGIFAHLTLAFEISDLEHAETFLLRQLSLLPPKLYRIQQLEIWLDCTNPAKQKTFHGTIKSLVKKGWLQENNDHYGIHRLIQQLISYQVVLTREQVEPVLMSLVKLTNPIINERISDLWHLSPTTGFFTNSLTDEINKTFPVEVLQLMNNTFAIYHDMGMFDSAFEVLNPGIQIIEKYISGFNFIISTTLSHLGLFYQDMGDYNEAAKLLEQALKLDESHLPINHPEIAKRKSNLGMVYKDLGRHPEAVILLESALDIALQCFGSAHSEIASKQSNLAVLYEDLGKNKDAIALLESALFYDEQHLGKHHPNVAIRKNNLAHIYIKENQYARANEFLTDAILILETHYKNEHPILISILTNQADICERVEAFTNAADLMEKALSTAANFYKNGHPTIEQIQSTLSGLYFRVSNFSRASNLLENLIANHQKNSINQHELPIHQLNLSRIYFQIGKGQMAKPLLEAAKLFFEKDRDRWNYELNMCYLFLGRVSAI